MRCLAKVLSVAVLACMVAALAASAFVKAKTRHGLFCDLNLRYSEICCSHEGVNPFWVWERELSHPRYKGLERHDKPDDPSSDKMKVHAYPPWHTTLFWWYPWLPRGLVLWGMFAFNLAAFVSVGVYFARKFPLESFFDRAIFCLCGFLPCAYLWGSHLDTGNYPLFVLSAAFLMVFSLRRGRDVLAGIFWSLMMVKPQMATLAFWPLFLARRFKTIATAVAVVCAATLLPAYVYGESPLELILQVPRMGMPYMQEGISSGLMAVPGFSWMTANEKSHVCVAVVGFLSCGVLCAIFAKSRSWIVRFMPALIMIPVWTYSLPQDRTVFLCLYFPFGLIGFSYAQRLWGERAKLVFYAVVAVVAATVGFFPMLAAAGVFFGFLGDEAVACTYRIWQSVLFALACTAFACVAFNIRKVDNLQPSLP